MPAAQTVATQENAAYTGGHGFVCAAEAIEQTPPESEVLLTREQAINELLIVHDEEEARRQKCFARFRVALLTLMPTAFLLAGIATYFGSHPTHAISKDTAGILGKIALVFMMMVNVGSAWFQSGWRKNTPLPNSFCALISDVKQEEFTPYFSSPTQQNIITAMLNYPDEPRIAEALCRALDYYRKDKNRLYVRLARLLPLLTSDGSALSETARRNLFNVTKRTVEFEAGNEKEQTLPVLQAAAKEYFARTGEPTPRPKRKWFKRRTNARQKTKEIE